MPRGVLGWYGWILVFLLVGCSPREPVSPSVAEGPYNPEIDPADFVGVVDNPYFPVVPGARYVYEGQTEDGLERTEVEVLSETRQVMGLVATVVRDTVYLNGEMIEDTLDWYAQDQEGNVWYMGEEVNNFQNGQLVNHSGSWEAGVDGARPGIVMFADPAAHLGETYRQEYYAGIAEDMAELLSVSESMTLPYGSFTDVVQTRDFTPLEPGVEETKYYAPGIGLIREVNPGTGEESVLIQFIAPES
jgi:hypothetical protein